MRRGAVLLECVLALALFVSAGMAVLALVDGAVRSVERTRDLEAAVDLARSAIAKIEAGIATAEELEGPVPAWRDEEDAAFGDEPPTPGPWSLEITTEPALFDGLTRVRVRAIRTEPRSGREEASFALDQLVPSTLRSGS